jgi:mannose-1-phosphate guanylyltransferase/mannose-6-phosphate isomerase
LTPEAFVAEPIGRNTAPAIAVAAALAVRAGDPLQLVVPADHLISDVEAFWRTVDTAAAVAAEPQSPLVTFGIPIGRPETGYGYIERGEPHPGATRTFGVRRFHEKPDSEQARAYQTSGRHYWNSGIFLWRASALLAELAQQMPALHALVAPLVEATDPVGLIPGVFEQAEAESIDWGVLEKSSRVVVVEAGFDWSDVGNWSSWGELSGADEAGNVTRGEAVTVDSRDCLLYSDDGLIATLGVANVVVVRTAEATLVIDRDRCQEIRELLRQMREREDTRRHL